MMSMRREDVGQAETKTHRKCWSPFPSFSAQARHDSHCFPFPSAMQRKWSVRSLRWLLLLSKLLAFVVPWIAMRAWLWPAEIWNFTADLTQLNGRLASQFLDFREHFCQAFEFSPDNVFFPLALGALGALLLLAVPVTFWQQTRMTAREEGFYFASIVCGVIGYIAWVTYLTSSMLDFGRVLCRADAMKSTPWLAILILFVTAILDALFLYLGTYPPTDTVEPQDIEMAPARSMPLTTQELGNLFASYATNPEDKKVLRDMAAQYFG